jgi:type IV pilus assembly protein PilM
LNAKLAAVKEKVGVLVKKIQGVTAFLMGPQELLAVDIGSFAIKCCFIKTEGGVPTLKLWGYLPYTVKPDATPDEKKAEAIKELKAFLIQKGIKNADAATSLSGNSVIVRYVKFPRLTKAELTATLATEAEPFIPFDINEVQLGFHILNEVTEEGQKKMETVLVAAKKDLVVQRLDVLQAAGLFPMVIDVDSFSLENVNERVRDVKNEPGATLYLNIGHMVTNLSIIEAGITRVVRDIFISGNTFNKAIIKALQVDAAKAEELKRKHGIIVDAAEKEKALQEGQREALGVSQAVATVAKDLVSEVHRSVDFYLSQGPERSIGRIVLMGGSAKLPNLAKHLSAELKVPVGVLDPFTFLKNPPADLPADLAPSFAVAVGLALRRNRDWV